MGSSTETVTGMGYSKMFGEEHADLDLMMQKIAKEYGVSKSIDPAFIGPSLLQIRRSFNPKLLDKLEIASMATGSQLSLTDSSVLAHVRSIDPTATDIVSYTNDDSGCNDKLIDAFMYEEYGPTVTTDCSSKLGWEHSNGTTITYSTYYCDETTPSGDSNTSVMLTLCDGSTFSQESFPSTSSGTMSVVYNVDKEMVIFTDDAYVETQSGLTFLAMDYKLDGKLEVEKYITIVNSILGMADGTLDETLEDDKIRDFFLGYAAEYGTNEDYDKEIDKLFGTTGYIVEWGGNTIKYDTLDINGTNMRRMSFNGATLKATEEMPMQYMLPLDFLFNRTMREQYDDFKNLSTFFVFTSEEVKVKWYQSGWLKILGYVIAIVRAYYGDYSMLIMMITAKVVSIVFKDSIIGQILLVVIAILAVDPSSIGMNINTFTTVVNIAQKISNTYYMYEGQRMIGEINNLNDEAEAERKILAEMRREMIYMPLDEQDAIYSSMYENVYAMYSNHTDYDHYFRLPKNVKV